MPIAIRPPLKSALLVFDAPLTTPPRVFPITSKMTIGRLGYGSDGNPVQMTDALCSSGKQFWLTLAPTGLSVAHCGSTNITTLNGQRADRKEHPVHVGDEIQGGHSIFRFEHTLAGDPWPAEARGMIDAVLASPRDDAPRRVLADWLNERGDPRGEFIECQLSTRTTAIARAEELLRKHELEWIAPLPVPVERWTFARGFLDTVRVRDVAAAEVLRRHHPLSAIEPLSAPVLQRRHDVYVPPA